MLPRTRVMVSFIFLVGLVASLYVFSDWFSRTTGYVSEDAQGEELAKCITESGGKYFSAQGCPDCDRQRGLFGDSAFEFINFVDCTSRPEECSSLQGLPAWQLNDSIRYGVKGLEELRFLSGCSDA